VEQRKSCPDSRPEPRELNSWKELPITLASTSVPRKSGICRFAVFPARVSADVASLDAWKQTIAHLPGQVDRCYRWPLGPNFTAQVRFVGAEKPSRLCDHLLNLLHRDV
jgi:hypothetical protein